MRLAWTSVAIVAVSIPKSALALSCVELPDDYTMFQGSVLPTNARPKVIVRRADPPVPYTLICSKEDGARGLVEIDTHDLGGDPHYALEIVPRAPLAEGSACAIVARDKPSTWFQVHGFRDTSPPRARTTGGVIDFGNERFLPELTIKLWGVKDDTAPADDLIAAVWTAAPGAPLRYDVPPSTWRFVSTRSDFYFADAYVRLGYGGNCGERSFEFPAYGTKTRMGIKLIDPAGNTSEPLELALDGAPNPWQTGQLTDQELSNLRAAPITTSRPQHRRRGWLALFVLLATLVGWVLFTQRQRPASS